MKAGLFSFVLTLNPPLQWDYVVASFINGPLKDWFVGLSVSLLTAVTRNRNYHI